jgi:hypothetical protein
VAYIDAVFAADPVERRLTALEGQQ